MTVRDAAVKSERTQLPLRGAVRGLWTLAGKHLQAVVSAEYGAILGRRRQRERAVHLSTCPHCSKRHFM